MSAGRTEYLGVTGRGHAKDKNVIMKKMMMMAAALAMQCTMLHAAEGDTISLSEKWLFKIAESATELPRHLETYGFDDTQWLLQKVSGTWSVPADWAMKNYAGAYRGWVKMPAEYKKRRVFLHIGYVPAVANIYINEHFLGKTGQLAQTEFDITPYIRFDRRNLFAFSMSRYEGGEPMHAEDKAGFTTGIYVYALPQGEAPAPAFQPEKAVAGSRVADRQSVEPYRGFLDTKERMAEDAQLLRNLGFNAVTYNKLSFDPDFIAAARKAGLQVVSDKPLTSTAFVDADRHLVSVAYRYLPQTTFSFQNVINNGKAEAAKRLNGGALKIKRSKRVITIKNKACTVVFDRQTGFLARYMVGGVELLPMSGEGGLRPAMDATLVSLNSVKPRKGQPATVSAVYDLRNGKRLTWKYTVLPQGVMTVTLPAQQQVSLLASPRLNRSLFLAQDLKGETQLTSLRALRPRVLTATLTGADHKGVMLVGNGPLTVGQTSGNRLTIEPESAHCVLTFLPK